MAEDIEESIKRVERSLNALLAVSVDTYLRSFEGLSKPRPRSIDKVLNDAGLTGVEISRLLGKSPQAVSNMLARESKQKVAKFSSSQKSPESSQEGAKNGNND